MFMLFRKAVLIIHGFAGGVYDYEYLSKNLELIRNYDVFTFTLAGHDGLFKSNMTGNDWIKSTTDMMDFLIQNGYKNIYVIGHSMGGVLGAMMASRYKEVKKLVLVSAAFRFLKFNEDDLNVVNFIKAATQIAKDYPTDEVITRFLKMPIPAVKEFSGLVHDNQNALDNILVPTLVIQGNCDDMVPLETASFIYDRIPSNNKKILVYDGVNHDVFRSDKKEVITNDIIAFLKK